jgi:hypothetical protein
VVVVVVVAVVVVDGDGGSVGSGVTNDSGAGANVIKLFTAVSYDFYNKLERLSLVSLSRLV